MKKLLILLSLFLCCFFLAQVKNHADSMDSLLNYFYQNNAFSGTVLIQKKGETVYKGNFNKFPNKSAESDKYRIGSVTKVFTAIVIFQLVDEGKLSLNTKLSKFFPSIKNADGITIGNLLNHSSGIYNFLDWKDYYISKNHNFSRERMVQLISEGKPDFKPGKDVYYSNSNYLLLGYIIEDITRKSYKENIKDRIADRIGLKNTYVEQSSKDYVKRNTSYKHNGETWAKENDTNPSFIEAAGAIVSTGDDMARLAQELFNGNLISKSSLEEMKKTDTAKGIGHGLFRVPFYEKSGFGHTGRIDEFHSFWAYFPEDQMTMILLMNGATLKGNEIAKGIASIYFDRKYEYPKFTKYEGKTAATNTFTGIYTANLAGLIQLGKFEIIPAGKNYLFMRMYNDGKDSEKVLLERTGEYDFYAFENGAQITFLKNAKGEVNAMQLTQGKQSVKCKKVN